MKRLTGRGQDEEGGPRLWGEPVGRRYPGEIRAEIMRLGAKQRKTDIAFAGSAQEERPAGANVGFG